MVLNRWRNVCPSCFDAEAERAGVRYEFVDVGAMSWSNAPGAGSPVRQEATLDHWMSPTSNDFLYWLRVDGFYLFEAGVTPAGVPRRMGAPEVSSEKSANPPHASGTQGRRRCPQHYPSPALLGLEEATPTLLMQSRPSHTRPGRPPPRKGH